MKIYKMTATFGKLEHGELTLQPGLNILTAPNEWGKSTWCAFLMAMLYGLDTRAKTTKTVLADKERYAPWSGSPMAGRIDLNWNGRDITIERRTKGRVPLGEFKAYETASGLAVPELTAANCGQTLLGVEQTVFRRAGFIRQSDMPVTQDEALRRRLNDLVTTGDESGAGDRLAKNLRDLKNRCRYNKSGLLPQLESQRDTLQEKIGELDALDAQVKKLKMRLGDVKSWLQQLNNHQAALDFSAAEADAGRVAQAREALEQAQEQLTIREAACEKLPPREDAEKKLKELRAFRDEWNGLQMELQMLPRAPLPPAKKEPFTDMDVSAAIEMVNADRQALTGLRGGKMPVLLLALGAAAMTAAIALLVMGKYLPAGIAVMVSVGLQGLSIVGLRKQKQRAQALETKYGTPDPERWLDSLREYERALRAYNAAQKEYQDAQGDVEVRLMVLRKRRDSLCGAQEPDAVMEFWQQVLNKWEAYHAARRETLRAQNLVETLSAMAKPVRQPAAEDNLTYSEADTARLLSDCKEEQQRLQSRISQYKGRMEALGDRAQLEKQLDAVNARLAELEKTYTALTIAQDTLVQARAQLQRRFAPRISQRAQELLSAMTVGRYQRLSMGEDFSLQAGAEAEETLHDALWRSDGTVDQLYLALRLAVAEELTPEAPLILDDALVRFDDQRMKAALDILGQMADTRQVILFTCQQRETQAATP
ncbi:MAG: ATP-binding protein [Faecousia sp.]